LNLAVLALEDGTVFEGQSLVRGLYNGGGVSGV